MSTYSASIKGVLRVPVGKVVLLLNEWKGQELSGGRVELGESSTKRSVREIAEELNLHVEVGALVDTYLFEVAPGKHVFVATCACALLNPFELIVNHEHKHLGLSTPNALPVNLPAGCRTSITAACNVATPPDQHAWAEGTIIAGGGALVKWPKGFSTPMAGQCTSYMHSVFRDSRALIAAMWLYP